MKRGNKLTICRRVRNRLSQRAIRERRAIRIQQLEEEVAQTRQSNAETRWDDLRAQNEKLRNGLHETRKKLLSVSTTTSSVADTIRSLLDLDPTAQLSPQDEIDSACLTTPNDEAPVAADRTQESPTTEEIVIEQGNGLSSLSRERLRPAFDLGHLDSEIAPSPALIGKKQELVNDIWDPPETWEHEARMEQMGDLVPTPSLLTAQVFKHSMSSFAEFLPGDRALMLSSRRSVSNFSDHLDHIFKLLRLSGIGEHFSSAPLLVHSMLHCFIRQCWPVMDHWFQVTNSCAFMKSVMWWQTTKSPQSFLDMPGGYSPTPSQLLLSYPCIVDWIPHPTIRNVMAVNYESYPVDEVICDITDAYVVENEDGFQDPQLEPLSVMEMVQRYNSPGDDTRLVHPYADITASQLHPQAQFLQTHRFKIDPSFFIKYPGLYDATAIAKTSCSSIRIHERVEINHQPLPFSVASANAYLDVISQAKANEFR